MDHRWESLPGKGGEGGRGGSFDYMNIIVDNSIVNMIFYMKQTYIYERSRKHGNTGKRLSSILQ